MLFVLPAVVFDTIVAAFLTFGLYWKSSHRPSISLISLIIRDGILYFVIIFLSNVAWVVVHLILSPTVSIF